MSFKELTVNVFLYSWILLVDVGKLPIVLDSQPAISALYQLAGT